MSGPSTLRVCIVTDAYLPSVGGVENHVLYLSAELERLGHKVLVVTHKAPPVPGLAMAQVESPVSVHRLAGGLLVFREHDIAIDPRMVASFERLLDQTGFDIVHGQSEGSYLVYEALTAARRRNIPTVLTRHSVISSKPALARWCLIPLTRLLAQRADGLIAVSHSCLEETAGFAGPVRVIANGVDTDEFRPKPEERRRLRQELGLAEDDLVIGYVGRLHTTKGVPMLLDVFEELGRSRGREFFPAGEGRGRLRLLLAGPGPLRAAIQERARASAGTILLLEPQPYNRVASLLNALDVFALPSRGEAFGISLLEAMACGLASVALSRWGVKELVEHDQTGLLADGPADFRAKLGRLVAERGLRERLGRAARRKVEEQFSWPRVAEETAAFYRELVSGAGRCRKPLARRTRCR